MRRFTRYHEILLFTVVFIFPCVAFLISCKKNTKDRPLKQAGAVQPAPTPTFVPISDGFSYPVGSDSHPKQTKVKGWYNAQDFAVNDHLGEDWNAITGGNTDCGLPVYAASKGTIIFADEAGPKWGKVIIVRHRLPDSTLVETLYSHLQSFARTDGEVSRREKIGSIGDGGGAYVCHLHFELRLSNSLSWGQVGPGYSPDRTGWTDPSDFIDANRSFKELKVESRSNR